MGAGSVTLEEGIKKTVEYFRALDLRYYKRPTMHTAHKNSEDDAARHGTSRVRRINDVVNHLLTRVSLPKKMLKILKNVKSIKQD